MFTEAVAGTQFTPHVLFVNARDATSADVAVHLSLARHLPTAGAKVSFTVNWSLPSSTGMRSALRQTPGVGIMECSLGKTASGRGRVRSVLASAAAAPTMGELSQFILRHRVDVLHATDRPREALLGVLTARLTGRPSVIHMHSNYYAGFSRASRWAFAHCSFVIGVSQFTTHSLQEQGVSPHRLAVVHNAVDANHFSPEHTARGQARARWGIPADAPLIGLVGRLIPYKGHLDLLEALACRDGALGTVHVLIVGETDGPQKAYVDQLRAHAAAMGLSDRVHFTGQQADVRPIYRDIDLLAVPSWDEPFGLVVTEAMAMETPVVAYHAGGIPEIVTSGREGLLVRRRDTTELRRALLTLLHDPGMRTHMGTAGRRRVMADFTPARQAEAVLAIYRRIANTEKKRSALKCVSYTW